MKEEREGGRLDERGGGGRERGSESVAMNGGMMQERRVA